MMHQRARDPRPRILDLALLRATLLAFLLPVFAWAPLTYPGYFVFRSGFLPIFNLADRVAHLADLSWMPTVAQGYSLFGGEGPFPYWVGGLPVALGVSPVNAIKWVLGLSFVVASAGCYFWLRRRLGAWPALVAAALYVFNPISLGLVYVGGAYAQAVLLAIMPWVLWAVEGAVVGRKRVAVALPLLAAAALWSQAGLALAFLLVVLADLLLLCRMQRFHAPALIAAAAGLAGGLVLAALGLLPAFLRHGSGAMDLGGLNGLTLLVPWIALLGGWIAGRLGEMLPEPEAGARPALFAALIALALLLVYGDLQPVATAGVIPNAPLAIFGENEIALLSVQMEGTPGPNGSVAVDVAWQALRPLARDYTVFFHVIAGADRRVGQLDTMPQAGQLPTSQWQPGEVVRDRYDATLSPDAPAGGDYRYWLGWYLGETGQRLAVRQGAASTLDDKYVVQP